jgi:phenylacetaldehyde dehydrogenase
VTSTAAHRVEAFLSRPRSMFIAGSWVDALSGARLDAVDPATGKVLTSVPAGDANDVDLAVTAARSALEDPGWRDLAPMDRGRLLDRLADLIEQNADELALLEAYDNGKPVSVARAVDVGTSIKLFRYFAGWPSKFEGATIPVSPRGGLRVLNYTVHEPVGVVAAIVPWNFPMSMACWKLAPALATGNAVVLKPAEDTSLTTLRMAELAQEAGFPAGVLNVVTGLGSVVGAALAAHDGVDKIAFTGSTEVGRQVAQAAAASNLKNVSLELGGKSPNIVLPDADLDQVLASATDTIFFNQGQVCTAGSRLYLHAAVYDEVIEGLVQRTRKIVVGPGTDPATQMGPLVSARQLKSVSAYLDLGREQGATVLTGGGRVSGLGPEYADGYFVEPTIFADTDHTMRVVREEIFGPVLVAMRWEDEDELVRLANDTPYGLGAGIWTSDLARAHQLAARVKAGTVWVNCYNYTDPASPFGGYKQSGWGREMGRAVLEAYTETKSVWVNIS